MTHHATALRDYPAAGSTALRRRAIEIRNHADAFCDDAAAERLHALADEYEARASLAETGADA